MTGAGHAVLPGHPQGRGSPLPRWDEPREAEGNCTGTATQAAGTCARQRAHGGLALATERDGLPEGAGSSAGCPPGAPSTCRISARALVAGMGKG